MIFNLWIVWLSFLVVFCLIRRILLWICMVLCGGIFGWFVFCSFLWRSGWYFMSLGGCRRFIIWLRLFGMSRRLIIRWICCFSCVIWLLILFFVWCLISVYLWMGKLGVIWKMLNDIRIFLIFILFCMWFLLLVIIFFCLGLLLYCKVFERRCSELLILFIRSWMRLLILKVGSSGGSVLFLSRKLIVRKILWICFLLCFFMMVMVFWIMKLFVLLFWWV